MRFDRQLVINYNIWWYVQVKESTFTVSEFLWFILPKTDQIINQEQNVSNF